MNSYSRVVCVISTAKDSIVKTSWNSIHPHSQSESSDTGVRVHNTTDFTPISKVNPFPIQSTEYNPISNLQLIKKQYILNYVFPILVAC